MIRATFKCENCDYKEVLKFSSKVPMSVEMECPHCHKKLVRQFGEIETDRENENVSAAIQTMMYSKMPSQRDKAII